MSRKFLSGVVLAPPLPIASGGTGAATAAAARTALGAAASGANTDITSLGARPTWAGLTPWDSGNFNPSSYATLASPTFTGVVTAPLTASPLQGLVPINGNITSRIEGGMYNYSACTKSLGWPEDSGSYMHLISDTWTDPSNYYSMQIAGGFFDNTNFYLRKTANSGTTPWNLIWHSGNFNPSGYAPLASPAFTGTPTAPTPTAGDNSTKLATTAFLVALLSGLGRSVASSGYQRLPGPNGGAAGGVTIQWGQATPSGGDATVTFPVAFGAAPYSVQATPFQNGAGGGTAYAATADNFSATSFQLHNRQISNGGTVSAIGGTCTWFAVGPT